MALKKCKECSAEVSDTAEACPKCGAKMPKKTSRFTKIIAGLIGVGVLASIFSGNGANTPQTALSNAKSPSAPAAAVVVKPPRKPGTAVASLAKKHDKIEAITWYQDKSSPMHANANGAYIYMGDKGETAWLRLRVQFHSDDWLFIKSATFVINGEKRGLIEGRWERDNSGGKVWEWSDSSVGDEQLGLLKAMASAKEVIIRFDGAKYRRDRTLNKSELSSIKNVLKAYTELGGNGI